MTIDFASFTPLAALAGGALIGLAAAMLVLCNGRIAGVSGIVGGLLRPNANAAGDVGWRLAFVIGLLAAPLLYQLFAALPASVIASGNGGIIIAGLLVGIGTRYGSGCTSGHGVTFMAAGFITVFVMRHVLDVA